jgi:hypothetical protein
MISVGYKNQLIVNAYNIQLLPVTDEIHKNSISSNKHIKNQLLFRIDDESSMIKYKYKFNNIEHDIFWFLNFLINPIYSIYKYSGDKEYDIQQNISYYINAILRLRKKQDTDNSPDYTEYLEDIYD